MNATLPDPLARAARATPDRPAVIAERATLSYAALDEAASRGAAAIRALGLAPGERVALLATNGPLAVAAVHAARRARVVLVPLHPRLAPGELAWQVEDAGARLLLHDDAAAGAARAVASARPDVPLAALDALFDAPRARVVPSTVRLRDAQGIVYTSGSTARPRGVVLTHANHWWSAVGSALRTGSRDDDRWLLAL
ncbi:MAG: AMP-binding protein, partial [Chloroflexota bacterium]